MTGVCAAAGLLPTINQMKLPEKEKIKVIIWPHSSAHCVEELQVPLNTVFRVESQKYLRLHLQ